MNCPECGVSLGDDTRCASCGFDTVRPDLSRIVLRSGELLDAGRYLVTGTLRSEPDRNVYTASDLGRRVCPACHAEIDAADDPCPRCGAPPGGATGVPRHVEEVLDPELLAGGRYMVEAGVDHPGLVNARAAFAFTPYGGLVRHYLVTDPDEGTWLSALPRPQDDVSVLGWGRQLAGALDHLHARGLAHGDVRLDRGRLAGHAARLVGGAVPLTDDPVAAERDAEGLAGMLAELAPGAAPTIRAALLGDAEAPPTGPLTERIEAASAAGDRRPGSVTLESGSASDVGRLRDLNEDCLLSVEVQRAGRSHHRPVGLYVVADGLGGHASGEVASALVVDVLGRIVLAGLAEGRAEDPDDAERLLVEACLAAGDELRAARENGGSNMGATVVAAVVVGAEACVAHLGDSRAYLVRDGAVEPLTTDHSLVQRWVDIGQITPEEARSHPRRNLIYRQVGDQDDAAPDVSRRALVDGDWLLLCSDGLTGMLRDDEIAAVVTRDIGPQAACDELVRRANDAGGEDNVTVIAVRVAARRPS